MYVYAFIGVYTNTYIFPIFAVHLTTYVCCIAVFQFIRTAWQAASEWVQGYDELNVASVRFRLYVPGETLPARWQLNVLRRHEVCVCV